MGATLPLPREFRAPRMSCALCAAGEGGGMAQGATGAEAAAQRAEDVTSSSNMLPDMRVSA
ncbi:MAG: hypothetical protein LBL83_08520 [Clostridiales bacterium]|jgi:hypothetical protein|nr:hypothetical protein [Clostridiales bacterium]